MASSTLTSKGQVTIPKEIRERLGLRIGARLVFETNDRGEIVVHADESSGLESLFGLLHHLAPRRPVTVKQMHQAVRRRAAAKALSAARA